MDRTVINWENSESYFLINSKWPLEDQQYLKEKVNGWISTFKPPVIIVPTSGTTSKSVRDTKLVVHLKENFLNSARAVGETFDFSSRDRVAITLPQFHVGGLSQEARAFLWNQEFHYFLNPNKKWDALGFHQFLIDKEITHTSLVPTQVFDLVQLGLKAPEKMKVLFVGGAFFNEILRQQAETLGWKTVVTFGMTETASMIATLQHKSFKVLPHAQVQKSTDGFLQIKCKSLFLGYLKNGGTELIFESQSIQDGWFQTEDYIESQPEGFNVLGRSQDYVKIGGEGVYLPRLQNLFQEAWLETFPSHYQVAVLQFVPSERLGHEVHIYSVLNESELQKALESYNKKVLPFERIRGFHQISEIPTTELGKVKFTNIGLEQVRR